jgi:hypothetical protein
MEAVMFGSVFKMTPKAGKKQELIDVMMGEGRTTPGMKAAYLYDTGGDEIWGVAVFESEKSYRDNANSPEQNAEYERFRALLTADPEWHDGNIHAWPGNKA